MDAGANKTDPTMATDSHHKNPADIPETPLDKVQPLLLAFNRFLGNASRAHFLLMIAGKAIHTIGKSGKLESIFGEDYAADDGDNADRWERLLEQAKQEHREDLPTLYTNGTISMWARLEALVKDVVIECIRAVPDSIDLDAVSKVKVPLAEFLQCDSDVMAARLVEEIERSLGASHKPGVDRFESLLATVGLSEPVGQELRRDIYEASQVRNVILHRAGIADRRFVEACSGLGAWSSIKVGGRVTVTLGAYHRYLKAARQYVVILTLRIAARIRKDRDGDNS